MTRPPLKLASVALLAAGLTGCAGSSPAPPPAGGPVWPPRSADSPGGLAWRGQVDTLRASGLSGFLRAVSGAGEGADRWALIRPVSVALSRQMLYTVDTAAGEVVACRRDGSGARRLSFPDGFTPVAVALGPGDKEVFVADGQTGEVLAFKPSGAFARKVVRPGVLERCGGIAVEANGNLLLTDVAAGMIYRFGPKGNFLWRVGRRGTTPGEFNFPTAIVRSPDTTLWVLDTLNFRLQHLNSRLERLSLFGQLGDGTGHFALPKGLAVDGDGLLYVSDARFDNIQVFNPEGQFLYYAGRVGSGPGEYWNPAGLAYCSDGTIAVADSGNHRVQLLQVEHRETPGRRKEIERRKGANG